MHIQLVSSAALCGVWRRLASCSWHAGALWWGVCAALLWPCAMVGASPPAGATPSFPLSQVSVSIDSDEKERSEALYVNKEQCEVAEDGQGVTIEITVTSLSTQLNAGAGVLELWVGQYSQDCSLGSNRQTLNVSLDHKTVCYQVADPIYAIDATKQKFKLNARSLFSSDPSDPDVGCDLQSGQSLWILPLANATPTSGAPGDAIAPALEIRFVVDVTALGAPTDVSGGSGETQAVVDWDAPSGADTLTTYEIYYDLTGISESADATCSSELLVPGAEAGTPSEGSLERVSLGNATRKTINPGDLGLAIGEKVPLALVALDAAGNRSVLSEVVCLRMVDTQGFWDACDADASCRGGLAACSAAPWTTAREDGGAFAWELAGLLFALLWRKRPRGAGRGGAGARGPAQERRGRSHT
ncbi:MAG: hypothetical protein QM778_38650 [Myxococcales bacterium]